MTEPFSEDLGGSHLALTGVGRGVPVIPPDPPGAKPFGLGLSAGTLYVDLHNAYPTTFAYSNTIGNPKLYYAGWGAKLRALIGLTLTSLSNIADLAAAEAVPYDCLGYNLESSGDPGELDDIAAACAAAKAIATANAKPLLVGLGGALADERAAEIPACAASADYWLLQGQRQQIYPPLGQYKTEISARLDLALSGNPATQLIVQVTTWNGMLMSSEQVHAYVQALVDLDPTYAFHSVNLADFHDPNAPAILAGAMALYYA